MRYVGIYWSLFAPMIKKSIRTRFDTALAERSIREGKKEYKRLLSRADELGPGNPMAMNAYLLTCSPRPGWEAAERSRRRRWRLS